MDDFLTGIDRLAALAGRAAKAPALDTEAVMARIASLELQPAPEPFPLRFLTGLGAAAAAAAAAVTAAAMPAWREVLSPLAAFESLPGLQNYLHL